MSMLGAADGERRSYLEIADALRAHGAAPRKDLADSGDIEEADRMESAFLHEDLEGAVGLG